MLDNRELVVGGGTQPSTGPVRGGGLDGSATAEERDNYHRDAHMNDRNHAPGAPSSAAGEGLGLLSLPPCLSYVCQRRFAPGLTNSRCWQERVVQAVRAAQETRRAEAA